MAQAAPRIRSVWPYRDDVELALVPPRSAGAQRGIGLRAKSSFPIVLCEGPHVAHCRAVELSPSGIVVERGRELSEREQKALLKLELFLEENAPPVRVLAKVARRTGPTSYALKLVLVADVDRLTLMEHLDRQAQDSLRLLDEVMSAEPLAAANA